MSSRSSLSGRVRIVHNGTAIKIDRSGDGDRRILIDASHRSIRYDLYGRFTRPRRITAQFTSRTWQRECATGGYSLNGERNDILYGRFTGGGGHRESASPRCNCNRACRGRNRGEQCLGKIDAHAHVRACRTCRGVECFRRAGTVGNT